MVAFGVGALNTSFVRDGEVSVLGGVIRLFAGGTWILAIATAVCTLTWHTHRYARPAWCVAVMAS